MSSPDPQIAQQSLDHAKTGYQNAQDVIKFMDTKFGAVAGLSILLCGFQLKSLASFLQLPESTQAAVRALLESHTAELQVLVLCAAASLISGVACIVCAISGVMARAPRDTPRWLKILASIGFASHLPKRKKYKHTVLFPFWTDSDMAVRSFRRISRGMTHKEISAEYVSQLWNLGAILQKKIALVRWAAHALVAQMIFLVAAAFCLGSVMYVSYGQPIGRGSMNPTPAPISSSPHGARPDVPTTTNAWSPGTTSSQTQPLTPNRQPQPQ